MLRPWTIDDSDETRPLHDARSPGGSTSPPSNHRPTSTGPGSSAPTPSGPTGPRSPTSSQWRGRAAGTVDVRVQDARCRRPVLGGLRPLPRTGSRVAGRAPPRRVGLRRPRPRARRGARQPGQPGVRAHRPASRPAPRGTAARQRDPRRACARTPSCSGGGATTHTRTPARASPRCSTRPCRPSAPSPRASCAPPAGHLLLCELVYKREWDLPGGVVDRHESPAACVVREVREELDLSVTAGPLLAVNWLPALHGWGDATVFVFDLGTVDADVVERAHLQQREILGVHWAGPGTGPGGSPPTTSGCSTRCTRTTAGRSTSRTARRPPDRATRHTPSVGASPVRRRTAAAGARWGRARLPRRGS